MAIVASAALWFFYRRDTRGGPAWAHWGLPTLRALAVLLAILTFAGPILRYSQTIGELGNVLFCIDASSSMQRGDPQMDRQDAIAIGVVQGWLSPEVADTLQTLQGTDTLAATGYARPLDDALRRYEQSTRFDRVTGLLWGSEGLLAELQSTHRLSVMGMVGQEGVPWWNADNRPLSFASDDLPHSWPATATAPLTDLTSPVLQRLGTQIEASAGTALDAWELAAETTPQSSRVGSQAEDATADPDHSDRSDAGGTDVASPESTAGQPNMGRANGTAAVRNAVVLLTDGQHNTGPSPLAMAGQLASQGIPIFCVGFGGAEEPTDLAVLEVVAPAAVASKNRVRGTLVWKDRGPAGRPVQLRITADDRVLWQQAVLSENQPLRRTEFDFAISELVEQQLRLQSRDLKLQSLPLTLQAVIQPLADETDTDNNQLEFRLSAVIRDQRMLLIDGRSRWESRYLRNLFDRDEGWSVTRLIIGPGTAMPVMPRGDQADRFPAEPAGLSDFDVVVLGEFSGNLISQEEQEWIREYVARGGGLVIIDGARGAWSDLQTTRLADLLPVRREDSARQAADRFQLTTAGNDWPALQLRSDAEENKTLWQQLPPSHGLVPVRPLPGAETMVEAVADDIRLPAIVRRRYGSGQIVYLAFDDSWRWRFEMADRYHGRFWNQVVRAIMQAPYAVSDAIASLDTGAAQYQAGEAAEIRVRLRQPDGRLQENALVDALLTRDGQPVATINLSPVADQPGLYRGKTDPLEPGLYRTRLQASGFSDSALQVATEFRVSSPPSRESLAVACNEALLQQIARESGGAYLHESEADKLKELLKPLSAGRTQYTDLLLWRSYWWFFLIVGLLACEWLLRKRAGLI